jgi:hypothetical protein
MSIFRIAGKITMGKVFRRKFQGYNFDSSSNGNIPEKAGNVSSVSLHRLQAFS